MSKFDGTVGEDNRVKLQEEENKRNEYLNK